MQRKNLACWERKGGEAREARGREREAGPGMARAPESVTACVVAASLWHMSASRVEG